VRFSHGGIQSPRAAVEQVLGHLLPAIVSAQPGTQDEPAGIDQQADPDPGPAAAVVCFHANDAIHLRYWTPSRAEPAQSRALALLGGGMFPAGNHRRPRWTAWLRGKTIIPTRLSGRLQFRADFATLRDCGNCSVHGRW
jgi:hypothetical protein